MRGKMVHMRTWCVYNGQIGAVLVLDLDDDLLGPKLLLTLQPRVLILYIFLCASACPRSCTVQLVTSTCWEHAQGHMLGGMERPAPALRCLQGARAVRLPCCLLQRRQSVSAASSVTQPAAGSAEQLASPGPVFSLTTCQLWQCKHWLRCCWPLWLLARSGMC